PKPRPSTSSSAPGAAVPLPRPAPTQAALPTPAPAQRTPTLPAMAMAPTASTSRSDMAALNRVVSLVRSRQPGEATAASAAIGDPVARKLAEWIILRSENHGATVERYRDFIAGNSGWPSLDFMRRRAEAALWDDRRDDNAVLTWFQNETPLSAKGRLVLARAALNRGDRRTAERLVRETWREDSLSAAMERAVLDQFGALLTGADHKARMDSLLYRSSEREAAWRAAQRLGGAQQALAK